MRTKQTTPPSFFPETLKVRIPKGWEALAERELLYICALMAAERFTVEEIQLRYLRRFAFERPNPPIWEMLSPYTLLSAAEELAWLEEPPTTAIRPAHIGKYEAIDAHLFDERLKFGDFLICENLFQSWISSQIEEPIEQMAKFLYRTAADEYALNIHLSPAERYAVIFWWTGLKAELATRYDELFRRIPAGAEDYDDSSPAERQRESTDAQIRALTAGDITKEPAVLKTETHRALTELNAKAREARITMQKMGT